MSVHVTVEIPSDDGYKMVYKITNTGSTISNGMHVYNVHVAGVFISTISHWRSDGVALLVAKAIASTHQLQKKMNGSVSP